ncbi:MAG TPA: DUF5666 domain-containing protein, partial [Anaerolineales bacterium]|nr:DUF5666 domain-containing protein [Anaerolineales bacterium]HNO31640.1 DUF5666 domain-containing protein [Anaerolineales bacterium]
MKKISNLFLVVMALFAVLISACGGAAATSADTSAGAGKPQAAEFTGVIEAINGDQWTVNGQVITVDPSVLRDGPFAVGDTVKVEVEVQTDGSVVVTRVETPAADDNTNVNDNANGNANDNANGNVNDNANSNSNANDNGNANTNDDNSNGNSNGSDDNGNDDNGGNSNGSDDNGNDDNGGNGNGSDDNGNDDNGGNGNG